MFDIIKLVIETMTPIIVLIFGIKINKILKKQESVFWTNQKILEKRLEIYDKVIFKLNDIYCFHCYIGNWKELNPFDIIEHKRNLDKIMNSYAPLFINGLLNNYDIFMEECYTTFSGWGNDPKIKSLYIQRENHNKKWEKTWKEMFDYENIKTDKDEKQSINNKKEKYKILMESFKENLDIFKPGNYKYGDNPNINFFRHS
jgi:hypothetical protein